MLTKKTEKTQSGNVELNFIGNGVTIKGDMTCDKDLRLDGTIDGNLKVDAKLVLGKAGKVIGTIYAVNADISGEINGNIDVKENLTLREAARINGDIKSKKINIESGALFNGSCIMTNERSGGSNQKTNQVAESTPNTPKPANQVV